MILRISMKIKIEEILFKNDMSNYKKNLIVKI